MNTRFHRWYDSLPEPKQMLTALGLIGFGCCLLSLASLMPPVYGVMSALGGCTFMLLLLESRKRYRLNKRKNRLPRPSKKSY